MEQLKLKIKVQLKHLIELCKFMQICAESLRILQNSAELCKFRKSQFRLKAQCKSYGGLKSTILLQDCGCFWFLGLTQIQQLASTFWKFKNSFTSLSFEIRLLWVHELNWLYNRSDLKRICNLNFSLWFELLNFWSLKYEVQTFEFISLNLWIFKIAVLTFEPLSL